MNHYIIQNSNYTLSDLKDMTIFEILEISKLINDDIERKYNTKTTQ